MWRHSYRELEKTTPSLISRSHWRLHTPSYLALIVSKASISLGTKGLVPRLRQHQQGTITGKELGNMQCLTQRVGQTVSGIYKGMKLNALVAMVTVTYEKQPRKNMPSMCVCVYIYILYSRLSQSQTRESRSVEWWRNLMVNSI